MLKRVNERVMNRRDPCLISSLRDLKPENILLGEDMHIQVTDFGTAKIFKEEGEGRKK